MFFALEPEVAGGLGPRTVLDGAVHPPRVEHLHYEFQGWLGDALVESFPCFIVTAEAAAALEAAELSGLSLADCEVTQSDDFRQAQPDVSLPVFRWLLPTGGAGQHDFGLSSDHRLVVSDRARSVLARFALHSCDIERWPA